MKRMTDKERQEFKNLLLLEMTRHVGASARIGMGELYETVFGDVYNHRINDTRKLRTLISELRQDGVAICSSASNSRGGYWLASAGSELTDYCGKLRSRALKLLAQEATLRKMTLPELAGQVSLELSKGGEA